MQSSMYKCRLTEMDMHLWVNSMFQGVFHIRFLEAFFIMLFTHNFFLKHFNIALYSSKLVVFISVILVSPFRVCGSLYLRNGTVALDVFT